MNRGLDYNAFRDSYELEHRQFEQYCKYQEAEISLELDKIAGGMIPELTKKLFFARLPELIGVKYYEVGNDHVYEMDAYDAFASWALDWDCDHLYEYFNTIDAEGEVV